MKEFCIGKWRKKTSERAVTSLTHSITPLCIFLPSLEPLLLSTMSPTYTVFSFTVKGSAYFPPLPPRRLPPIGNSISFAATHVKREINLWPNNFVTQSLIHWRAKFVALQWLRDSVDVIHRCHDDQRHIQGVYPLARALNHSSSISYLLCVYFWCSDIPRSTDIKYVFTFSGVWNITGEQHIIVYILPGGGGEIHPRKKMIRDVVYNKRREDGDNLLQIVEGGEGVESALLLTLW